MPAVVCLSRAQRVRRPKRTAWAKMDFQPRTFHDVRSMASPNEDLGHDVFGVERHGTLATESAIVNRRQRWFRLYLQPGSSRGTLRRLAAFFRALLNDMKFPWSVAIASIPCVLAACTGPTLVKNVETPKPTMPTEPTKPTPSVVHLPAGDATTSNAGAPQCSLQTVQQIGAFAKGGGIAVGFGEHSGLVAWSSPEGLRIKPLTSAGVATGSAIPTPVPKGTKPIEIIATGRGFAVIAKRIETTTGPCEAACGDKPCPEVKPDESAPQTCEKPTGHEFFVLLTDQDGKNPTAGRPFHTGLVDIETILPGDGRAIGVMTKNEIVWIQRRPDGRLDSERIELPSAEAIVPVRGLGPPAVLLVDKDGSMQLLDERGVHDIEGKFMGMQPKAAAILPKRGATPAGKPPAAPPPAKPASDTSFRSHWGANGRLEVARRLGNVTQYATIEKLVLRMLNDSESSGVRELFANSIDVQVDNGHLRRIGWDKQPIGSDIDVHQADPAADISRMRYAWSGSAFVFAHPSNPPHQVEAQAVGIVAANCASVKP